jgi:hypothetical protein
MCPVPAMPTRSAVNVGRFSLRGLTTAIDDSTGVVFAVVVVVKIVVVVREGMTTPDLGRVISPMGRRIVGPIGALRGTKMMPATPAPIKTREATVHQMNDGRLLFEDLTTLNVLESGSKSLSPYAWRRRRRTRPRPAMPKKRRRMLTTSTPPLTDDVAEPPRPVPGAPEGIVAGGMCGAVVGALLWNVVDVIGGVGDVVLVVDVVEVVDVVPDGVVGDVVEVTGLVVVVVPPGVVVVVLPGKEDGVVGIVVVVVEVVDELSVVVVVPPGSVVDVVDCELTLKGSQSPVEPGYDGFTLPEYTATK